MNKILSILWILALCVCGTQAKMLTFDSILKCAGSFKKLVSNYNKASNNLSNPHQVIAIASSTLKSIPGLLSGCGKQEYSQLYSKYLSRRCLDLVELQAQFAIKIVQYKIQLGQNSPLTQIYSKLEGKVRQEKYKQCKILQINLSQVIDIAKQNRCFIKSQKLFQLIKGGISIEGKTHSLFENLQFLYKAVSEAGMTCIQQMNDYFPILCLGELYKMLQLVLKMEQYQTSTKWIWQNVSGLRLGIQSIRKECSKLAKLL